MSSITLQSHVALVEWSVITEQQNRKGFHRLTISSTFPFINGETKPQGKEVTCLRPL